MTDDDLTTSRPRGLSGPQLGPPPTPDLLSVRVEIADPGSLISKTQARWLVDSAARVIKAVPAGGGLAGGRLNGCEKPDVALSGEIRVRLLNDSEMAAAHVEYCEIEGTTDVLTFDMSEVQSHEAQTQGTTESGDPRSPSSNPSASEDRIPVLDVDILACVDEAARQAAGRGHSVEHELLLYILHGTLHCLGHDDHDEHSHSTMHAAEDRVLEAAGFGAIYASPKMPAASPSDVRLSSTPMIGGPS